MKRTPVQVPARGRGGRTALHIQQPPSPYGRKDGLAVQRAPIQNSNTTSSVIFKKSRPRRKWYQPKSHARSYCNTQNAALE
ncbi:hypothetical protein CTA1_5841 [Colletotrichum tanaceti]|uniref:Uncharacterized protein n=1 Tax=Colletotrichum tanaceti TaxID=1306861 RepID=A0A4V6Y9E7_9PEZI|nr:hypothetical protein CTA1_5841 [Colletotrichum tanaceti]